MKSNQIENLRKQGKIIKNSVSYTEDETLFKMSQKLVDYLRGNVRIHDDWEFMHLDTISMNLVVLKLRNEGVPYSATKHLTIPNPKGKIPEIKPDGGCVATVKRNDNGEIISWFPLVVSESKHQGSPYKPEQAKGNAIERVFKNYNVMVNICRNDRITPFACFCQGCDMDNEYVKNKLRQGFNCDIGSQSIKTDDYNFRKPQIWAREETWTSEEIYEKIKSCALEAYEYYKHRMD